VTRMRRLVLPFLVVLAVTAPAAAEDRGFVRGLGGVTFEGDPAAMFGGGGGINVGENLSVTLELGRMQNVSSSSIEEDLDSVVALARLLGFNADVDLDTRLFYGLAGLRYDASAGSRVRPFLEASGGFATVSHDLDISIGGFNVPRTLLDQVDTADHTDPMFSGGGGVRVDFSENVGMDLGYRYSHVFVEGGGYDLDMAYGALRFSF
jgi:opacity protein-like surface antigen